jgi:hypothetical protein
VSVITTWGGQEVRSTVKTYIDLPFVFASTALSTYSTCNSSRGS